MYRLSNVLQLAVPQVVENLVSLSEYLLIHRTRNAHTTRLSQLLNSRRQIYAIPVNVVAIMNNFTEVDANPEVQPLFFRNSRIFAQTSDVGTQEQQLRLW